MVSTLLRVLSPHRWVFKIYFTQTIIDFFVPTNDVHQKKHCVGCIVLLSSGKSMKFEACTTNVASSKLYINVWY